MPILDVSIAVTSPMLVDQFNVQRRTQTVGTNGRATITSAATNGVFGVVYPSEDNELKRLPDLQVTGKTITVITRFALRGESNAAGTDYQPDVVVWHGDNFLVKHVEDWAAYGPGYILAICTSMDAVDAPPSTE